MAEIKGHYFIRSISLHTTHPSQGGVLLSFFKPDSSKDESKYIECGGRVACDITEKYVIDAFVFAKVRFTHPLTSKVQEGWTWLDNVQLHFEQPKMDGRFNQVFRDEVKVTKVESKED